MKFLIKILVPLLVLGGVLVYLTQGDFGKINTFANSQLDPCGTPIKYRIAEIDPKFNLDETQVLKDINQGAQLWNSTYGGNLFEYDPRGDLPIYFVYDKRQELNTQINSQERNLNKSGSSLEKQTQDFKAKAADYEARLNTYNEEVEKWNKEGGAPPEAYDRLTKEVENLQALASELNETAKSLNLQANNYNFQVGKLKQTITTFNEELEERPEEGIYISQKTSLFDPGERRIEIYFVPSKNELIHTLVHEFGHSIRIEHNENPKSIMFSYTSESLTFSFEDKSSLQEACRKRSLKEVLLKNIELIGANINLSFALNN